MATVGVVGSGFDSGVVGVNLAQFVVPAGVVKGRDDGYFAICWSASVASEVPPTVTPLGPNWTTLVAPRTIANMGFALFRRGPTLDPDDTVAFQFSSSRVLFGLDIYVARADTPVAGAVTDRASALFTNLAASASTVESAQLCLIVSAERSPGVGTVVSSAGGATTAAFRESSGGSNSLYFGWVSGSTPAASSANVTVTYSTNNASGTALQVAIPSAAVVVPTNALLRPASELVGVAWLRAAVPYLGSRVATELPMDNSTWAASGFTTVGVTSGTPDIEVPVSRPLLTVDCYGVAAGAARPPWNLAAQQAAQIYRAALAHATVPRWVSLPAAYNPARVLAVIPRSEPRRLPGDQANYARFQMDLELWWSE